MVERMMVGASREVVGDYTEAYGRLETEMDRVTGKLEAVEKEKAERGYRERQCKVFLKIISNLGADSRKMSSETAPGERLVDKEMLLSLMDRVVVGDGLVFQITIIL